MRNRGIRHADTRAQRGTAKAIFIGTHCALAFRGNVFCILSPKQLLGPSFVYCPRNYCLDCGHAAFRGRSGGIVEGPSPVGVDGTIVSVGGPPVHRSNSFQTTAPAAAMPSVASNVPIPNA